MILITLPCAITSGLLWTVIFPQCNWPFMAWICLIPLLIAINHQTPLSAFRTGWICGFCHYITLLYWIAQSLFCYSGLSYQSSWIALCLLCAYLSCYPGFFSLIVHWLCKRPLSMLAIPFIWIAMEYLLSLSNFAFPWELIGYSQYQSLALIQFADITGVYGISAFIVLVNVIICQLILFIWHIRWQAQVITQKFIWVIFIMVMFIISGVYFYGIKRINDIEKVSSKAPQVALSLVQGNIQQNEKWKKENRLPISLLYLQLSLNEKAALSDLIIWPETALPYYLMNENSLKAIIDNGLKKINQPILIGSPSFIEKNNEKKYYNSAYIVNEKGEILDQYDKIILLPFAEYNPIKTYLPFFKPIASTEDDFSKGELTPIKRIQNKFKPGIQICYEIIFPASTRQLVNQDADILINITNDAWFGNTSAPYQHFSMVIYRAIETRRSVVRCANTGISAFIEPTGRIRQKSQIFQRDVLNQKMPILTENSIYVQHGDWLPKMSLILVAFLIVIHLLKLYLNEIKN